MMAGMVVRKQMNLTGLDKFEVTLPKRLRENYPNINRLIAMKFCTDTVHPQRRNLVDFRNRLTFPLAPT